MPMRGADPIMDIRVCDMFTVCGDWEEAKRICQGCTDLAKVVPFPREKVDEVARMIAVTLTTNSTAVIVLTERYLQLKHELGEWRFHF